MVNIMHALEIDMMNHQTYLMRVKIQNSINNFYLRSVSEVSELGTKMTNPIKANLFLCS